MTLAIAAGQIITADLWNAMVPLNKPKFTAQTVTNSVALVNDTELFLDLAAGRYYDVTALIACSGAAAGDIKLAWATTGSIALLAQRACLGPALATTDRLATTAVMSGAVALGTAQPYGVDPGGNIGLIQERLLVSCSVAGRLTLQWAQNALSATATTVWNTSYLSALPVA